MDLIRPLVLGAGSLHCILLSAAACFAQQETKVDFASEIQTILARRCYACHGPDVQEGSLRFDQRETLVSEADTGEIPIVVGEPEASELIRRVLSTDESEQMPPEGKRLSEDEVELLRRWISQGAEFSEHWAFKPIADPIPPKTVNQHWSSTAIDQFVLSKIEEAGLQPADEANPEQLIRRVYFDVTGLPPSPERIAELKADWDWETYELLVDELLATPQFGERWARVWLDVVRYAETNSFERDGVKPNAWKYRDYVIQAMNSDKPYDRFLLEQLAGDELEEVTTESLTATGYYRLGLWDDEPADPLQAKFDGYDDLVTTTSQGMLGLTLNCARCHDHKIDPLTQKDYYSMVAFMRDVTPYGSRGDQRSNNQIVVDPQTPLMRKQIAERIKQVDDELKAIEQAAIKKMSAPDQRATEGDGRQKVLREKLRSFVDDATWQQYSSLKDKRKAYVKEMRSLPPAESVLGLAKVSAKPEPTYVLTRGSPHAPQEEEVVPQFPKLLGGGVPDVKPPSDDAKSTGRRLALARWITSNENRMTARVIVNRLWLHYFGAGIVGSPNNFGLMGETPTHPLLMDHLASRLMKNEWSLKSIHREILLSSTYRQSSLASPAAQETDPANSMLSHQNLRRLSAEQIRDAVLAVTGELNTEAFGKSFFPTLSKEVLSSQSKPGNGWGNSSPSDRSRRSVYIHIKRSLSVPMLAAFDFPETDISCEARFLTVQPGQALSMLNSDWIQQQAGALLARVRAEVGTDLRAQAQRVLELTAASAPDPADIEELMKLVERLQVKHGMNDIEARQAMCLVSLNRNSFMYIE